MITNIYCVQHYAKCFPHIISLNKNTLSCPQRILKRDLVYAKEYKALRFTQASSTTVDAQ